MEITDKLEELVLSFFHVGSQDQTQKLRLGGKHLYQLSPLTPVCVQFGVTVHTIPVLLASELMSSLSYRVRERPSVKKNETKSKHYYKPGMVVHTFHPSTQEAAAGR
jgi:hypothetical protein